MSVSEKQYQAMLQSSAGRRGKKPTPKPKTPPIRTAPSTGMNKLEAEYAQHLDILIAIREIISWKFEEIKLRLADRCWYTVDFMVTTKDKRLEAHETKGHWREDARIKWKGLADKWWPAIRFLAVKRIDGEWIYEEYRR